MQVQFIRHANRKTALIQLHKVFATKPFSKARSSFILDKTHSSQRFVHNYFCDCVSEPARCKAGIVQQRRCETPLRKRLISLPGCHYGSQSYHFIVRIFFILSFYFSCSFLLSLPAPERTFFKSLVDG